MEAYKIDAIEIILTVHTFSNSQSERFILPVGHFVMWRLYLNFRILKISKYNANLIVICITRDESKKKKIYRVRSLQ